jgi:hypothetical protein
MALLAARLTAAVVAGPEPTRIPAGGPPPRAITKTHELRNRQ